MRRPIYQRTLYDRLQSSQPQAIINARKMKLSPIEEMRQAYGIPDDDIYNFDGTGFMMGVAATSKVVISSDTVGRATVVQPGNRDWVTAIECINASGWCLPPFVILSGKQHQASWYRRLPPNWVLAVSDNGWTTGKLGVEWVKHFNRHTASCTRGVYRLLILDGHSSHATPEFDQYCTENKSQNLGDKSQQPLIWHFQQAVLHLAQTHDNLSSLSAVLGIR